MDVKARKNHGGNILDEIEVDKIQSLDQLKVQYKELHQQFKKQSSLITTTIEENNKLKQECLHLIKSFQFPILSSQIQEYKSDLKNECCSNLGDNGQDQVVFNGEICGHKLSQLISQALK